MTCPRCGSSEDGAFCSRCGANLGSPAGCARCGRELVPGARYCVQCGSRAARVPRATTALVPVLALAVVGGAFWLGRRSGPADAPAMAITPATNPAGVPGGTPPPLTGSLRDQADRLFERIMRARAAGNDSEVEFFLPMALSAYEGAGELDADGQFHLGLLLIEANRIEEARTAAERIRTADPSHLFGHALAAEAALAAGDSTAARAAYRTFVSTFDAELARALPEYGVHRPALDEYLARGRSLADG